MSFAYKLWKIGRTLTEHEIMDAVCVKVEMAEGEEPQFINIDFRVSNNEVQDISHSKNSIRHEKLFFTKKIGGTSNSYYLYPNLNIQAGLPKEKIQLLVNTLKYSMPQFVDEKYRNYIDLILEKLDGIKKYIERAELELEITKLSKKSEELKVELNQAEYDMNAKKKEKEQKKIEAKISKNEKKIKKFIEDNEPWDSSVLNLCKIIVSFPKDNYWLWFSINGKTFYELMPEAWVNWYKNPFSTGDNLTKGYDVFTNSETEIGYQPDIKVFSYDQYHDSLAYRLNYNLPFSLESARNIKFAWMYIINNLVFYYKGLEYVLIPNIISDDLDLYKTILNRFRRANKNSSAKKSTLERLNAQEKRLEKDIDKLSRKKAKTADKEKLNELVQQREEQLSEINKIDTGMIREFDEQIKEVGDIKDSITIDYIFTSINRTNLSFEIKGSIEDVIPSQVRNVVTEMAKHNISDLVKLGKRDRNETLLQDFFNRNELSFIISRSKKNNANKILQERLYLAILLLTDTKIEIDQLLERFETNRLLGYDKKKRLTKDGIYEWIEFSNSYIRNEDNIYNFFRSLDKIKE